VSIDEYFEDEPPAPAIETPAEPTYQGAGSWSELPLPNVAQTDISAPEPERTEAPNIVTEKGPIGELATWIIAKIRSDSYLLFLGAAGVAIVLLLIILWLMP
jgi:hypothetical protein